MSSYRQNSILYKIFVLLSIIEILQRSYIQFPSLTIILSLCLYLWLYLSFVHQKHNSIKSKFNSCYLIYLLLFWNLLIVIRGLIDCEDYWDYKGILINKAPFLFFPISIFLSTELSLLRKIISYISRYYILFSILFVKPIFWSNTGRIISNLIPISLLFRRSYKYWIIIFVIISIPFTLDARGWIIRAIYGLFLTLVLFFRLKLIIGDKFFNIILKTLFVLCVSLPLVFTYLGYTGKFNVFAMDEYINIENKDNIVDTRTALYILVNDKLTEKNMQWVGLGGMSNYWNDFSENSENKELRNKGRTSTESGILNMYLYGGWIGALLYSLVFWLSSFYGIFRSNNFIVKIIGSFIVFRWVVSFFDEPETWLCSNLMLYIFIGICLNKNLRYLSNKDWYSLIKTI